MSSLDAIARMRELERQRAEEDRLERVRAAWETKLRAPEFYAFAQEFRRVFGEGTKVVWVKTPDWEWGKRQPQGVPFSEWRPLAKRMAQRGRK